MKVMKITLIIIFSVFICTLVASSIYLAYNNRASEALWSKFLPALTIALVGACLTLWFSLKEEIIDIKFPAILATHIETGNPLEAIDKRYSMFYGGKLFTPRGFLRPLENQEISDFHLDILFIEVIERIFKTFQEFKHKPGTNLYSSSKYPTGLDLPRKVLEWEEFISECKKTPELDKLFHEINPEAYRTLNMTLPANTDFSVIVENHGRSIVFNNKFSEVKISVYASHGRRGLGEWQWLLDYDDSLNEQFWLSTLAVHLEARFDKLRSGHPDMPRYKNWVESIFDNIKSELDAEIQLEKAREYNHLYQNNINGFVSSMYKAKPKTDPKAETQKNKTTK